MIALSGQAGAADVERGREAGFSDYVAKFDRTALLASLRHCLSQEFRDERPTRPAARRHRRPPPRPPRRTRRPPWC
jgi:DNA-binding response OmpR family regulator